MRERPYFSVPNAEPIHTHSHTSANGQQAYQTNGFPVTPTKPFEFQNPSFPPSQPAEPCNHPKIMKQTIVNTRLWAIISQIQIWILAQ
jgi:hypothetical protein